MKFKTTCTYWLTGGTNCLKQDAIKVELNKGDRCVTKEQVRNELLKEFSTKMKNKSEWIESVNSFILKSDLIAFEVQVSAIPDDIVFDAARLRKRKKSFWDKLSGIKTYDEFYYGDKK